MQQTILKVIHNAMWIKFGIKRFFVYFSIFLGSYPQSKWG